MNDTPTPCNETVARLVNYLEQKGLLKSLALRDEDIADTLWLALRMGAKETPSEEERITPGATTVPPTTSGGTIEGKPKVTTSEEPSVNIYTPDTETQPEETALESAGLPFQIPAAPALPNKLAVGRALRPLKRKMPSPTRKIVDVEATVTRIAEQGIWLPVTQPEPERWLNLELVVEENRSSFIWRETIEELEAFLHNHGAFRRLRTWTLWNPKNNDGSATKPKLTRRKKGSQITSGEHSHRELISSNGQNLIILLSDCVSSLWQQETIYQWLEEWGKRVPTAIMQPFPEKLWLSTELGLGYKVKFSAFTPGISNSQLICDEDFDTERTLNLPIITLEAEYLKTWAKVIAGCGSIQTSGIVLDLEFVAEQVKSSTKQDYTPESPEMIVDRFLATASPTAQQLAGLMAAAPVSLPVVHLIQKTFFPNRSSPVHVAEVFLSGMIERKEAAPHQPNFLTEETHRYDFVGGVRKLLNQAMPLGETTQVLDVLSEYIADNLGLSIKTFTALLSRQQDLSPENQEKILPYAYVAVEVLRNLGGQYADFAEKVVTNLGTGKSTPVPEEPELESCSFEVVLIEIQDTRTFDFTVATLQRQLGEWTIVRQPSQAEGIVEVITEGVELELMEIPSGTFWMGSPAEELESLTNERPQHRVTVPGFYMGRYQVTQAQWKAIAERTDLKVNIDLDPDPSYFKEDPPQPPLKKGEKQKTRWDRPVEKVSWYEAKEFCDRLSKLTSQPYRLPTEAEWEYACRAVRLDTSTDLTQEQWNQEYNQPFHFGVTLSTKLANYDGNYIYGDGMKGEYRQQTTPVGYFQVANAFGLYDMHGNVWGAN